MQGVEEIQKLQEANRPTPEDMIRYLTRAIELEQKEREEEAERVWEMRMRWNFEG